MPPHATGARSTRQAAAVVRAMTAMPAFQGAREIRDAASHAGVRVGAATACRHLRVLAEQGSVDTIRGPGGETRCRLRRGTFTRHLTCRECEHTSEVDGREVWNWAQQVAARAGFTLTGHAVELTGPCPAHASHAGPEASGG